MCSLASSQTILKQQEQLIAQLVSLEQALRTELHASKIEYREFQGKHKLSQQALDEAEQKLKLAEHSIEAANKRNTELHERCTEISNKLKVERELK